MYQKIKYIIIATIVLLIIVVTLTLDANTRYASMNKQKKEQSAKDISDINRQYYEMQQKMNQAAQNKDVSDNVQKRLDEDKNLQNISDTEDEDENTVSPSKRNRQRLNNKTNNYSENIKETEESTHLKVLSLPIGDLSCESCEANETYKIEESFNLDGEEFAIISMTKEIQGSNSYLNSKYAIYKKVNDEYKYSNYLFETTSSINSTKYSIKIEENNNSIVIQRNNITRKLDNYVIKNGFQQYSNYPVLKYKSKEDTDNGIRSYQQ